MEGGGERRGCAGAEPGRPATRRERGRAAAGPRGRGGCVGGEGEGRGRPTGGGGGGGAGGRGGGGGGGGGVGGGGRRGGRWGEGEGGPARMAKSRNEETLGITMVEAHRRRRPSPEPSTKSLIGDKPKAPRRSSRRDKCSGTLGFRRRCTDRN
jgi:hypothetical protein